MCKVRCSVRMYVLRGLTRRCRTLRDLQASIRTTASQFSSKSALQQRQSGSSMDLKQADTLLSELLGKLVCCRVSWGGVCDLLRCWAWAWWPSSTRRRQPAPRPTAPIPCEACTSSPTRMHWRPGLFESSLSRAQCHRCHEAPGPAVRGGARACTRQVKCREPRVGAAGSHCHPFNATVTLFSSLCPSPHRSWSASCSSAFATLSLSASGLSSRCAFGRS